MMEKFHSSPFIQVHNTIMNMREPDTANSAVWVLDVQKEPANMLQTTAFPPAGACTHVPSDETMSRVQSGFSFAVMRLAVRRMPPQAVQDSAGAQLMAEVLSLV